ncbi:MAG: bifunctional demethylmenaquinone methyltransferase/2-methoxy-6-polyprenyl-1,4-benzoquinol methylase UbiE [Gammaproteobacteria bacterium]
MPGQDKTDFGFETVSPEEKSRRVSHVFSSVASRYDFMNDVMSLGVHRLWKRYAAHTAALKPGARVLDVAGGTGDMAALFHPQLEGKGSIVVTDINADMLNAGRDRLLDRGMSDVVFVQADAEALPFANNSFDCISIAFGLRNVTDKERALRSMFDCLRFGGRLLILEFSQVALPVLRNVYNAYSFRLIPLLGRKLAGDEDSYRYLVESIRMHPNQETMKSMMEEAGFSRVTYYNLSGGIVALHTGYRL